MQPKDFLDKIAEAENISIENIAAVRVNNEICSLSYSWITQPLYKQCLPVQMKVLIFTDALFLYLQLQPILFPGKRLIVGHSLGHGYYYTLDDEKPITLFEVSQLKAQMHLLIEKNLEITQLVVSYAEALKILEDLNLEQTRKSLDFNCPSKVIMNNLTGFSNIYYSPLLHRTGRLSAFDLTLYDDGFLLRFPPSDTPGKLDSDTENPKLFSVYKRYKDWGKRIGVTSAAELNYFIKNRTFRDFINITETLQNKCFAEAADTIQKKENVKVVVIAGPSSSGKQLHQKTCTATSSQRIFSTHYKHR